MRSGTVLVLGSGATLGGGFKVHLNTTDFLPPLDQNFFASSAVQSVFNSEKFPALSYYQKDASLEASWGMVDLYLKLCLAGVISQENVDDDALQGLARRANTNDSYRIKMELEDRRSRVPSMAGWELLALITEVLGNLFHPNPQQSPLKSLVEKLLDDDLNGVITFNYDTSLEQLFGDKFYYPLLDRESSKHKLPLFKLHGSLNWQTYKRGTEHSLDIVNPQYRIADMEHGYDWYRQPEVIGPTFFKQEVTFDIQKDFRAKFYRPLWANAWDLLTRTKNLVFVGFSFPQTDFHASVLFNTANLHGTGGFNKLDFCYKGYDPEEEDTKARVKDIFGDVEPEWYPDGLVEMVKTYC